mmetsp:Transcript_30958/g.23034  ORF Transcript_30958/g.23034 Transcript_30958/m.23034 type:complete len:135 (-) Transcript_30958:374-778(-)
MGEAGGDEGGLLDSIVESMMVAIVTHSLQQYHIDEKVPFAQAVHLLNSKQLSSYKSCVYKDLIRQRKGARSGGGYKSEQLMLDFGNYLMAPWLNEAYLAENKEVVAFRLAHESSIPLNSENLYVIRLADCSSRF